MSVTAPPTNRSPARPPRPLSPRQRDVLTLLARGYSCGQASHELGISPSVVHQHALLAEAKLRASNREQAIAAAIALGEISPQD
jgi:DNA-binding CsgD family transcriptional regulator